MGKVLTSASSVLPVPALPSTATPTSATTAPTTLMSLPLTVRITAAFPVAIKVTTLALLSPPVVATPVWGIERRGRIFLSLLKYKIF